MGAVLLPVSRTPVCFRPPAGAEDLRLAEAQVCDVALALELASALGRRPDGGELDWQALPLSDLDAALLLIRKLALGDRVESSAACAVPDCGARIDIAFRISDYLEHRAPRRARALESVDEPGWFQLEASEALFRLPTVADQLRLSAPDGGGERELALRCIRPGQVPARLRRRIETAIEALAPSLYGELEGRCPGCAARIGLHFDPQRYVLEELRARAQFVCEEIHLIATHYHWSEPQILALPQARRARYADLVHEARSGA
jgi:hypothetical protein